MSLKNNQSEIKHNIHPIFIRLLKWMCRTIVVQGPTNEANIVEYYRIMREAARNEFLEDNEPTLDAFLDECFEESKIK